MNDRKLLRTRAANWGVTLGVVLWVISLISWQLRLEFEHPAVVNMLTTVAVAAVVWFSGMMNVNTKWEEPYTYGRSLSFIFMTTALAGVAWGVGTFTIAAWIAPEYYAELINQQLDAMLLQAKADDTLIEMVDGMRGAGIKAMRNPFVCIFSGVLNLVMYGGMFGIVMAALLRQKNVKENE